MHREHDSKLRNLLSSLYLIPPPSPSPNSCSLSGLFKIPVKCLLEPRKSRLLREPNREYLDALKREMMSNPTTDVAPIIGVVRLGDGEQFDRSHPEAYVYETIGGNHSRIALKELLTSNDNLPQSYRFRTVSVYQNNISDEEAQHLALRHNRATEFTSKMSTQNKV